MLVSPTEPLPIRALGRVHSLPEKRGVDVLFAAGARWVGVQRKEIRDLVASVRDGRLHREVQQMRINLTSGGLGVAVLAVEGRFTWTVDGEWVEQGYRWTRRQHRGLLWSVRSKGIWVEQTTDAADTADLCRDLEAWAKKDRHSSLDHRPGPVGTWGRATSREWMCHLLQGLEGVGPELATRIVDHFGRAPIGWLVTAADLEEIRGIGKQKAKKLIGALEQPC